MLYFSLVRKSEQLTMQQIGLMMAEMLILTIPVIFIAKSSLLISHMLQNTYSKMLWRKDTLLDSFLKHRIILLSFHLMELMSSC